MTTTEVAVQVQADQLDILSDAVRNATEKLSHGLDGVRDILAMDKMDDATFVALATAGVAVEADARVKGALAFGVLAQFESFEGSKMSERVKAFRDQYKATGANPSYLSRQAIIGSAMVAGVVPCDGSGWSQANKIYSAKGGGDTLRALIGSAAEAHRAETEAAALASRKGEKGVTVKAIKAAEKVAAEKRADLEALPSRVEHVLSNVAATGDATRATKDTGAGEQAGATSDREAELKRLLASAERFGEHWGHTWGTSDLSKLTEQVKAALGKGADKAQKDSA